MRSSWAGNDFFVSGCYHASASFSSEETFACRGGDATPSLPVTSQAEEVGVAVGWHQAEADRPRVLAHPRVLGVLLHVLGPLDVTSSAACSGVVEDVHVPSGFEGMGVDVGAREELEEVLVVVAQVAFHVDKAMLHVQVVSSHGGRRCKEYAEGIGLRTCWLEGSEQATAAGSRGLY